MTSLTSVWRLYCELGTDFSHFSGVSIVHFEQVNADCDATLMQILQ